MLDETKRHDHSNESADKSILMVCVCVFFRDTGLPSGDVDVDIDELLGPQSLQKRPDPVSVIKVIMTAPAAHTLNVKQNQAKATFEPLFFK